jgi:hypothetical protein
LPENDAGSKRQIKRTQPAEGASQTALAIRETGMLLYGPQQTPDLPVAADVHESASMPGTSHNVRYSLRRVTRKENEPMALERCRTTAPRHADCRWVCSHAFFKSGIDFSAGVTTSPAGNIHAPIFCRF